MPDALAVFRANMVDADTLTALYDYLSGSMGEALSFDDLLRSKFVYVVSAFDKLIHDVVRQGMLEIYTGARQPTPKYLAEPIPMYVVQQLITSTTPPPEVIFEQTIRSKLKILSFQDPDKVSDGLAYIWDESQKWQKIATAIGADQKVTRTTLKVISTRRNSIVHEADIDPVSETKRQISRSEVESVATLLRKVGEAIYALTRCGPTHRSTGPATVHASAGRLA
ncbi:MAG: hypothetical protein DDT27_00838 [Dehalococcoidia bacterium]|nr:hypothetical protein [Chloroflexota bacterium]MBT9162287.1 hypothetical protein [Chloroflexota bacterium]